MYLYLLCGYETAKMQGDFCMRGGNDMMRVTPYESWFTLARQVRAATRDRVRTRDAYDDSQEMGPREANRKGSSENGLCLGSESRIPSTKDVFPLTI